MKDLAPKICRQRLVIEGYPSSNISSDDIKDYLKKLGPKLEMKVLMDPVTHRSTKYGWAGWVHWETSGAHFYAWDRPLQFFSVDIYTCRNFSPVKAKKFTQEYFKAKKTYFKSF